ncbi:MAG: hypothetical protein ACLP9L_17365 [Thermoguttaceae bacterium]
MRGRLAAILSLVVLLGCFSEARLPHQPLPVSYDNPILLRIANHELLWDGIVDVVSQYFRIEREDPVRLLGGTLIDGRIDTFPKPGATLLEPWDYDSADSYERLESTLQSIRRYAVVKVHPVENGGYGFWVEVAVYKELENVRQPEHATAGSAIFRNDVSPTSPSKLDKPTGANQSWIPQGRDTVAEQRILGQILDRFAPEGTPIPVN